MQDIVESIVTGPVGHVAADAVGDLVERQTREERRHPEQPRFRSGCQPHTTKAKRRMRKASRRRNR